MTANPVVTWLRAQSDYSCYDCGRGTEMFTAAADEIERLERERDQRTAKPTLDEKTEHQTPAEVLLLALLYGLGVQAPRGWLDKSPAEIRGFGEHLAEKAKNGTTGKANFGTDETAAPTAKPWDEEADYQRCLARILSLVDIDPVAGTREGTELDYLATAIRLYERVKWSMGKPMRYSIVAEGGPCVMRPTDDGYWVKYDDIAHLLRSPCPPPAPITSAEFLCPKCGYFHRPPETTACAHEWEYSPGAFGTDARCRKCKQWEGTPETTSEWPIPRCELGCGLARHKNSCEEAAEALGKARAIIDRASHGR